MSVLKISARANCVLLYKILGVEQFLEVRVREKYGLIKADDQLFGNMYSTTLIYEDCSSEGFSGKRPLVAHGVHGIVEVGDKFHLMSEDDGHYWTHAILEKEDLQTLKDRILMVLSKFKIKKNGGIQRLPGYRDLFNHEKFPIELVRGRKSVLISVGMERGCNKEDPLVFHSRWSDDLIKCLDLVENRPKNTRSE